MWEDGQRLEGDGMIWEPGAWVQGRNDRYRLIKQLPSHGAYGELWSVVDSEGRQWVLKRARSTGRADLMREVEFHEREAAATGTALSAPIHDVGVDAADPFFVRRPYDGDLAAWLASGPTFGERLQVLTDLCRDVARWHERGRFHRDLKPDNVLFLRFVDHVRPVLMDTALYRGLGRDAAQTGRGTPAYMSWEAGLRGRPVTAAGDSFALGVLTYEVLTSGGRPTLALAHQRALTAAGHRAQQLSRAGALFPSAEAELVSLVARPDAELVDLAALEGFTDEDERRLRDALAGRTDDVTADALVEAVEGCLVGAPAARVGALPRLVEALRRAREGGPSWVVELAPVRAPHRVLEAVRADAAPVAPGAVELGFGRTTVGVASAPSPVPRVEQPSRDSRLPAPSLVPAPIPPPPGPAMRSGAAPRLPGHSARGAVVAGVVAALVLAAVVAAWWFGQTQSPPMPHPAPAAAPERGY